MAPDGPATPSDADVAMRQRLERRLAELKADRTVAESDWHDLTRYLLPDRGRYLVQTSPRKPRGSSSRILDPTATKAHQRLAAFLMAGITNPALPWFKLSISDDALADDDDVKGYLAECQKRINRVLASGNYYNSQHQVYEEEGGFGTGVMIMLPDYEDVVRFTPLTCGEYYLALNDRQEVDTLYREYSLTVAQLVEQFGLENCSMAVQTMYANNRLSGLLVVAHAIEPNRERRGRMGWQAKPYTGVYFERGQNAGVLKIEGYDHRPFIAPRWHALAGDAYGSGPGHRALPDIKSLQAGVRQITEASEKLLNPPLQGDARHQNKFVGLLPGDINWIAGGDTEKAGLRPIFQVPPNIAPLTAEVEKYREAIKETFFNDLILAISQMDGVQPRNEMEIGERRQEKMLMLGPVLERMYTEALAPVILFVFSRMQVVGILPPEPPKLRGRQIEPKFVSVLAQAQKSVGTTGIEALIRLAGSMAGVWTGVVQKIDSDEVLAQYAEFFDVPQKIIVPQDQVDAVRKQAAQQAAAQQQAASAQQLAQGAQTLSQTDVGGGQNALAAMLGRGGGAPA